MDSWIDFIIWIDASKRLPLESKESMELTKEDATWVICNNYTNTEKMKNSLNIFIRYLEIRRYKLPKFTNNLTIRKFTKLTDSQIESLIYGKIIEGMNEEESKTVRILLQEYA